MGTFYLSTSRYVRNPVRVQTWNASIRAGDDFKLALTLYADDDGTPAIVLGSNSLFALWPDDHTYPHSWDYGLGSYTGGTTIPGPGIPIIKDPGFVTTSRPGGINFSISGGVTAGLVHGRYRLAIVVDLPDGSFTQVEGILQVRGSCGLRAPLLLHTSGVFFSLDVSELNTAILAALVENGIPCDRDGFPLLIITSDAAVTALTTLIAGLPTTLPLTAGVLWLNGGLLSIS